MPKTNVKPETEFHAEVIVEIVNTAINAMEKLGLSQEEALNGILSQVAVQVDAKAMAHANQLNQQLHEIYKSLNN
jgi:high-affinity Fe2+/Pb2+ permease